jgi:hypothetical protein
VKTIVPPWAAEHSRFTLLFEAFVIEVIEALPQRAENGPSLGHSWKGIAGSGGISVS